MRKFITRLLLAFPKCLLCTEHWFLNAVLGLSAEKRVCFSIDEITTSESSREYRFEYIVEIVFGPTCKRVGNKTPAGI
jgi:hypothetical protein